MIVSLSISNFRSFSSEETFSLVASKRLAGSHDDHTISIPDSEESVLKTSVIYGANGAGKSNLFKALVYLKDIALKPRKKNSGTGREEFRFITDSDNPSSFDLLFTTDNKLYRFGFKADDHRITEEWLVRIKGNKEAPLYERITDNSGNVTIESKHFGNDNPKLKALVTVGGPQNQSFLATIQATLETSDIGDELDKIISWFKYSLVLIAPNESFAPLGHMLANDDEFLEFAGSFLKSSSTGVDHLEVKKTKIPEEELIRLIGNDEIANDLIDEINANSDGTAVLRLSEGNEIILEKKAENHYYKLSIQASHKSNNNKDIPLELIEESDGTRRLLNLIPALHHLQKSNAVYFIDEIDRSMHPMLAIKFLEFFLRTCKGGHRQIILTTHESNLLDLELLRRDEIWFTEKDIYGSTHIYPLSDFRVRKDLDIQKHYLQGRFGAVPFLGNLDQLLSGQN